MSTRPQGEVTPSNVAPETSIDYAARVLAVAYEVDELLQPLGVVDRMAPHYLSRCDGRRHRRESAARTGRSADPSRSRPAPPAGAGQVGLCLNRPRWPWPSPPARARGPSRRGSHSSASWGTGRPLRLNSCKASRLNSLDYSAIFAISRYPARPSQLTRSDVHQSGGTPVPWRHVYALPVAGAVIFGGAGFIGRHLTTEFARNHPGDVVIVDISKPKWPLPEGARFVRHDVRLPIPAIDHLDVDLAINLAAVHRTPGHEAYEYFEANEYGAKHITEYCHAMGVDRIWFTSSIAVYGPSHEPRYETSPLAPTSAYGRSKVRAEAIHREWLRGSADRRLLIVRPAAVFGPGEGGNFTRLARSLRNRTFVYPGNTLTRKACGYVDDLVGSMHYMDQHAEPLVTYNFAYPLSPTTDEIVERLREVAAYPEPWGTLPAPIILCMARLLHGLGLSTFNPERVVKLMNSTNIVPAALMDAGYRYQTNLSSAVHRWYSSKPPGSFV